MGLDIQQKKDELIQWLSSLEDNVVIDKILELKKAEKSDWWHSISKAEKDSIEKGLSDAKNGNLKPDSEAKKVYGKWL